MADSSSRVRIAVAGLGRMGERHARNAAAAAGIDLVAVADVDERRAAALGSELDVPCYRDAARMLDETALQGLMIATPPATHVPLIELAAERSIHVLCEKPLSFDGPAAERALAVAADAGIAIQLGFQMRFDDDLAEIAGSAARGDLGRIYQLRASLRDASPPPREYLAASGGYFWDGAIHLLDLARWLLGEIAQVTAFGAALSDPVFEELGDVDNAMIVLRSESGALALLETSRVAGYGFESGVELLGSAAACRLAGGRAGGVEVYRDGAIVARHRRDFLERFAPAYPRELDGFADVVAGRGPARVTGLDGLAAMRLCEAAVRSHDRGETIDVSTIAW
jgi:myo-inositol 2-dehydrogenase/D-chiro-inositol 1-dehydrogenase